MNKKEAIYVAVISGTIVAIITVFVLTPLGDFIFKDNTNKNSETSQKENNISDSLPKVIASDNNIYYLQSYNPIEIFNSELILTLNNSIEFVNQNIELKIAEKKSGLTDVTKNTKVGDVYIFNNFIISFLSLEKNINTYDLKLKVERKEAQNNFSEKIKTKDVNEKLNENDNSKPTDVNTYQTDGNSHQTNGNTEQISGRPMRNVKDEGTKQDLLNEIKKATGENKNTGNGKPMR